MLKIRALPTACADRPTSSVCSGCGARAFSVCDALSKVDLGRLDSIAERVALAGGDILTNEAEPALNVFNITSGAVRIYKLLPDGRRQITGFLFAGDFIGLTAGYTYAFSAEAIEETTVCRFRAAEYRALARERPSLEAALLSRAMHELTAAQDQMLLLGRKTARERLASFLVTMLSRDPLRPSGDNAVRLPMTRSEIADYLGLTIETVSRELTKLKTSGVIQAVSLHDLRIERPDRLKDMANGAS